MHSGSQPGWAPPALSKHAGSSPVGWSKLLHAAPSDVSPDHTLNSSYANIRTLLWFIPRYLKPPLWDNRGVSPGRFHLVCKAFTARDDVQWRTNPSWLPWDTVCSWSHLQTNTHCMEITCVEYASPNALFPVSFKAWSFSTWLYSAAKWR